MPNRGTSQEFLLKYSCPLEFISSNAPEMKAHWHTYQQTKESTAKDKSSAMADTNLGTVVKFRHYESIGRLSL